MSENKVGKITFGGGAMGPNPIFPFSKLKHIECHGLRKEKHIECHGLRKEKHIECHGLRKDRFYVIKVKDPKFFHESKKEFLDVLRKNGIEAVVVLVGNKDDLEICEAKKETK